jgi:tetratricopeptide (TPR) repeat protein
VHATLSITADNPDATFAERLAAFCELKFRWVLAALLVLAGGIRWAVLQEFWTENPFATLPTLDSELYWQRAGEIAAGEWWRGEPFHIAPLYPYLLGMFRSLGGGLLALYGVQVALHLATAWAIAAAARIRFGGGAGLLAATLFLGLSEPALFATRILGTTLQLALVALLWWDWARLSVAREPDRGHVIRIGAWIGLLALAFPAAILLIPTYFAWLARAWPDRSETNVLRAGRAAVGAAAAVLVVAPATLHNAVATGDLIPITAHAGITLAAGNGPGSAGIFTPITETSGAVADQAHESARAFELATGRSGSWREIDAYFRDRTVRWWWQNPVDALALFGRKAWWFITSRHYDNVTAFALEREYGLHDASAALPLETPWLLGFALVGFATTVRRRKAFLPEIALVGLSFAVCLLFMYSARYRALAIPVLCGMAAAAVVRWDRVPWPRPVAVFAALLPVPLLIVNAITGFGNVDFMREDFAELLANRYVASGLERHERGNDASAEMHLRRAASIATHDANAKRVLASFYLADEQYPEARSAALDAVRRDPSDELAHRLLYDAQVRAGDYPHARITLDLIEELAPGNGAVQVAMAWFYAACPERTQRNSNRALHHARKAERLMGSEDPDVAMATALAAAAAGDYPQAIAAVRRGVAIADERADVALSLEFSRLLNHIGNRRSVAAQPRLLAGL